MTKEEREIVNSLIRMAVLAKRRAVRNGEELRKRGGRDENQLQFTSVVDNAIEEASKLTGFDISGI